MTGSIIQLAARAKPRRGHTASVGVVVQARMTSTRFPGKSMALLDGKPVLEHVLERAKQIRINDKYLVKVIVAVPDTDESEPMLELATRLKIDNFCGDEKNVLGRYYEAATFYKFDYIIRITADCPFINPRVSSEVIQLLLWRKCDYTSNVFPKRSYPLGLDTEAFSMDALEVAYLYSNELEKEIKTSKVINTKQKIDLNYMREHVTPFMQEHPEIKKALVAQKTDRSKENWCVDYPKDIARLEKLLEKDKIDDGRA